MPLCLLAGDATIRFAVTAFILTWPDATTAQRREQSWTVATTLLQLDEERSSGDVFSSAPMNGAVWDRGWWRWVPKQKPMTQFVLTAREVAASKVCIKGKGCQSIGELLPGQPRDVTFEVCS